MTTHNALVHHGPAELSACVAGFVASGLAAGERVLVRASPPVLARLHGALGGSPPDLDLEAVEATPAPYAAPDRSTMEYLDLQPDRRTRIVVEQDLTALTGVEVAAYLRREASTNVLYRGRPLTLLCTFDAATVPAPVLAGCRQTHEGLLEGDRLAPSPDYVDPGAFLRASSSVVSPPGTAGVLPCRDLLDLAKVRYLVEVQSESTGLGQHRSQDLVLAVNEVVTNALTHGQPPVELSIYREGPALVCHVRDAGPGISDPLVGYLPPPTEPLGGRGLWLARQLCDSVEVAADPSGSHVRLMMLARD